MSVAPTAFHEDGTVDLVHDDLGYGHTGTVRVDDLAYREDVLTGQVDPNFLVIPCPGACAAVSVHPVSGGVDPAGVQRLFVWRVQREVKQRTWAQALALVRTRVETQSGPAAWRLAAAQPDDPFPAPPVLMEEPDAIPEAVQEAVVAVPPAPGEDGAGL